MPFCKHCHKEITKFDTDICPHCGGVHPIEEGYKTMDITTNFGTLGAEKMPKTPSKKAFLILCGLLGYTGAHNFYIARPKRGIFDLALTFFLVFGGGFPLYFTVLPNALAFLFPFLGAWLFFALLVLYYRTIESPKDGKGDFLR